MSRRSSLGCARRVLVAAALGLGPAPGRTATPSAGVADVPALVAMPTGVERHAGGLRYDVDATRRLGARTAAVRALGRVGDAPALDALRAFARDDEVGHAARRALRGQEPRQP